MAENPCPYYADGHHMVAGNLPRVVDQNGNNVATFAGGGWYKCKGCAEAFISSGFPHFGWPIADYVTQGGIISLSAQDGVAVAKINRSLIRYTSAATLPGYKFVGFN
ncbi:hypothetical protein [Paenibacillus sp. FSL E2-0178]|uniref:hypothetical protein n=1 Tax=Paenibacillus sp. FSL E2-0178 TaxID=2921361 RepID=UPI003158CB41